MKQKTIITIAVIACLVISMLFVARSCKLDSKYRELKLQYAGYRAIAEADHELMMKRIALLSGELVMRDKAIAGLEEIILVKNQRIVEVSARLAELQNAEPVSPELESHPLVVNLRGQISQLTEMFTLSQNVVSTQRQEIEELGGKCIALESIGDEWKQAYEREHTLRVQAEEVLKVCEQRLRMKKGWGTAKTVLIVAAGAYIGSRLLK